MPKRVLPTAPPVRAEVSKHADDGESMKSKVASPVNEAPAVPLSHEHRVVSGPHLGKLAFSESMTIHPKDPSVFRLRAEEAFLMSDRDRVHLPSLICKV